MMRIARSSPIDSADSRPRDLTRAGRQQLTDAQRTHAASYRPGTIVLFRSNDDEQGLRRDIGYRVDGVDPSANTLRLLDPANQAIT